MPFLQPNHTSADQKSGTKQIRSRWRSDTNALIVTSCTLMTATRTDAINKLEPELTLRMRLVAIKKLYINILAFDENLTKVMRIVENKLLNLLLTKILQKN